MNESGTPKVSICLPVYNGEKFLANAIESALAQSFRDFELLIADDCSTDKSPEIAQKYAERDKRIVYWRNEQNKGLFANYNECISKARGELIKPFAQDDLWDSAIIETLVAAFRQRPRTTLAAVARQWILETGEIIETHGQFSEDTSKYGKDELAICLSEYKNWIGEPSAVMFRRSSAGSGFDTSFYHLGDLEYWLRILRDGDYHFINSPLCKFRRHAGSTTNKNIERLHFAIDMLHMADAFEGELNLLDQTKHQYKINAIRRAAAFISESIRRGELSVEQILSEPTDVGAAPAPPAQNHANLQAQQFRELALYALLYADEAVTNLESELHTSNAKLTDVLNSRYWKSGALVRNAAKILRASPEKKPL